MSLSDERHVLDVLEVGQVRLPQRVPGVDRLKELQQFVAQFRQDSATKEAAKLLGLASGIPSTFEGRLTERLFGLMRGRVIYELRRNRDDAILEPLFVTEAKVLLETLVGLGELF